MRPLVLDSSLLAHRRHPASQLWRGNTRKAGVLPLTSSQEPHRHQLTEGGHTLLQATMSLAAPIRPLPTQARSRRHRRALARCVSPTADKLGAIAGRHTSEARLRGGLYEAASIPRSQRTAANPRSGRAGDRVGIAPPAVASHGGRHDRLRMRWRRSAT